MSTPEKPPDVHDRTREWHLLARAWESARPELIFAVGRRRVGKSFVLAPFARAVRGVYYQATKQTEAEQLRAMSHAVGERFDDDAILLGSGFPDWSNLFRYLIAKARGERLMLVLDEFPYLAAAAPGMTSIIQSLVDHEMQPTQLKLVLSGSFITAMLQLEATDQPLHSRRTARVDFHAFPYFESAAFSPTYSAMDRLRTYAAFGGLPGHIALLDVERGFAENVAAKILDSSSRLFDEAQHMLDAFLGESHVHYSIIGAVASGEHTWGGITGRVGKSSGSLSRPMNWLVDMRIIRRITPLTRNTTRDTKRTLYRVTDPYVAFWHRFVAPLIHSGIPASLSPDDIWQQIVAPRLDDYMGGVFEEVCRSFVSHSRQLPFQPHRVGEWWAREADCQIDVVAVADDKLLVGECRWGSVDAHTLRRLRANGQRLAIEIGGIGEIHHVLFSGRDLADDEVRRAVDAGQVLHFSAADLFAKL